MNNPDTIAIKQHLLKIWDSLYRLSRPGGASSRVRAQMQSDILKMIKDIEEELDHELDRDLKTITTQGSGGNDLRRGT